MSFTSLSLDQYAPVSMTLARPDGSPLDAPANSPLSGCWGVDASGSAYFDPYPDAGQGAMLGWDGSVGEFVLDGGGAPDIHMMLLARTTRHLARVRPVRMMPPPVAEHAVVGDEAWAARDRARRTFTPRPQPADDRPVVVTEAGRAQQARARARG